MSGLAHHGGLTYSPTAFFEVSNKSLKHFSADSALSIHRLDVSYIYEHKNKCEAIHSILVPVDIFDFGVSDRGRISH